MAPPCPSKEKPRGKDGARSDSETTSLPAIGGCLSSHWLAWQAAGASFEVVSILRDGYRLPFSNELPPLSQTPISFRSYDPASPRALALSQEVAKMLQKGAVEVVSDHGSGFYSRLFLVEKATGGWRPVIDLSPLNRFIQLTPFRMETVASVLVSIREGDFMASIDLKDAYFQIPIHRSSRRYLRFLSGGVVYQFKALCFGLCTAPQVFTQVFATISVWAHAHGIRLLRYLDDWLILASSEEEVRQHVRMLLQFCHDLGIVVNLEKSELEPSQRATYLGMTVDTVVGRVFPTESRVRNILSVGSAFLSMPEPPARQWQVLLGHMASLEKLVPQGRLRMRSLQWCLRQHWRPETDPPTLPVAWSQEVKEDLTWWLVEERLRVGVPLSAPPPDVHLFSDASLVGWGAHLLDHYVSGLWSEEERQSHINLLELKAVFLALQAFQHRVSGQTVALMCDNATVVAYINKQGGTVSRSLCLLTKELLSWTEANSVTLRARFLPGRANVLADQLSRRGQVIGTEWSLHPEVCRRIFSRLYTPTLDLFATSLNKKLPLYCSLVPDPMALMEDAFMHPWDDLQVYAYPPFALVRRVLNRLIGARSCRMILVAPLWPHMEWYADLLSLLVAQPLGLPQWPRLLKQPLCSRFHTGVRVLNLHAWSLSSVLSEQRAFREGLRQRLPAPSGDPRLGSTSRSGQPSVAGVVEGVTIHCQPLFS